MRKMDVTFSSSAFSTHPALALNLKVVRDLQSTQSRYRCWMSQMPKTYSNNKRGNNLKQNPFHIHEKQQRRPTTSRPKTSHDTSRRQSPPPPSSQTKKVKFLTRKVTQHTTPMYYYGSEKCRPQPLRASGDEVKLLYLGSLTLQERVGRPSRAVARADTTNQPQAHGGVHPASARGAHSSCLRRAARPVLSWWIP